METIRVGIYREKDFSFLKKDIILYAFSTAVNRGAVLLFFPFLTQVYSLSDFGTWSLAIVISNLLMPVIMLNGSAAILREGSEDRNKGVKLLLLFSLITIFIGFISYLGGILFSLEKWLLYAIAIASAEALLQLSLTFIRIREKSVIYFLINIFKTSALLMLIIYAKNMNMDFTLLLLNHFYIVGAIAIIVLIFQSRFYIPTNFSFKPILFFSIALIPHGISQWIMSSSDRLLIDSMLGGDSVGVYSLAYNVALVLMLLNSGLAMALPTYMIKNYNKWIELCFDNKFIRYYTYLSIIILTLVISLYVIDLKFFGVLGYYGEEMLPLIFILYFSIYLLGLYCFFVNHLFYHKKASIISKVTFSAAIVNVLATILFVYYWGVIGAAIGTCLAYIYYLTTIRHQAMKVDDTINIVLTKPISIFFIATIVIYLGAEYAV